MNLKSLALASLLAPAAVCGGMSNADAYTTGDHSVEDAMRHYFGAASQAGQSRVIAVIGANITSAKFAQLEADMDAMKPTGVSSCNRANNCLKIVGNTGSTSTGFPSTDVAADRYKVALALATLHAGNTGATLVFIDTDKSATQFLNAGKVPANVPSLGIVGVQFTYGISLAATEQTTLSNWLDSNPILVTAPVGFVKWGGTLNVGFSTYTGSNNDTTWTGFSGANDIMALGAQILQTQDGNSVTADSDALAPAIMLALGDDEAGGIALRDDFINSVAGLWRGVPSSSSTLGTVASYGAP